MISPVLFDQPLPVHVDVDVIEVEVHPQRVELSLRHLHRVRLFVVRPVAHIPDPLRRQHGPACSPSPAKSGPSHPTGFLPTAFVTAAIEAPHIGPLVLERHAGVDWLPRRRAMGDHLEIPLLAFPPPGTGWSRR